MVWSITLHGKGYAVLVAYVVVGSGTAGNSGAAGASGVGSGTTGSGTEVLIVMVVVPPMIVDVMRRVIVLVMSGLDGC